MPSMALCFLFYAGTASARANQLCFTSPHLPLTHRPLFFLSSRRLRLPCSPGSMDVLPAELCFKIFHLLDHQALAAAPQVCRKWNALTCDDELWRRLFEGRWGADAAAFYAPAPAPEGSKPWKDVFVVQDRCDRYGLGVRIIREGNDYYLIYQGEIQSYLGTSAKDAAHHIRTRRKTAYADAKRVKA